MANKKKQLKVFFDTNLLWTSSASDLIPPSIAELVTRKISDPLLELIWYVPQIVIDERMHQMTTKASELLPSLIKLERVIGHSLAITPQILRERIESNVKARVAELNLRIASLDYTSVDWAEIVSAAVQRRPPFDPKENEKGFRDAIALETFLQEVVKSPKSPNTCRVVFVSGDEILRLAAAARTSAMTNTRILDDLSALDDLINTLSSEVTEDYVAKLRPKAAEMFFTKVRKDSELYFAEKIPDKIERKFASELNARPDGAAAVTFKGRTVSAPVFVRKTGNTIVWESRVTFIHELKRAQVVLPFAVRDFKATSASPSLRDYVFPSPSASGGLLGNFTADTSGDKQQLEVFGERKLPFTVVWSSKVGTTLKLTQPKIIGIEKVAESQPS